MTTRTQTEAAKAARLIRQELKEKYPSIKFSVKSDTYAGGDSVNVRYTDGPIEIEVERLLRKYEYGSFNSMLDLYEYDNHQDHPQVKYLFVNREISEQHIQDAFSILKETNSLYEKPQTINDHLEGFKSVRADIIQNYLSKCDLSKGFDSWMVSHEVYNCLEVNDIQTKKGVK